MAVLYTQHFVQFFDDNGNPLANGKLYAYSAGTTTAKATYTTEDADVQNTHPIILDASGRATIFIDGSYRFDLYDQNDVLIKSTDNVTSFNALNETGDPFFQAFSGNGSQTVFALSESLGSDSKDVMVFVNDESGDVGFNIQNPSDYTLSGTSLTFDTAPSSGTDNIYVFAPTKLLGAAAASASAAAASEASAEAAKNSAEAAAGLLSITSTSSVEIGIGAKSFTIASGLGLTAGQWVIISSDANPTTNYMTGNITSYSSTTLSVNIVHASGSGTLADWTIKLSGVQGADGAAGTVSATSGVTAATSAGAALISSGANNCLSWGGGGGANLTLGGNMSGASAHKLVNMADGTSAQDYVTKSQLDAAAFSIETGTFTPTIKADVDFTSYTAGAGTQGQYAKLGSLVIFVLEFNTSALTKGSASGSVQIGGLPYTCGASDPEASFEIGKSNGWVSQNPERCHMLAGTSEIQLIAGKNADITVSNVTAGSGNNIKISGTYFAG